ncbi:acyl-CoA N-acyltransferase [Gonapodya prolifera JEL478]|uniref:Acyl-CoA N-acyltransferase n=1 Tax=Gonapodya prolifera (strain JEL478) TaxID=1344416 RepID=A0A139A0L5_GONPJ|nr:acyl-CoA N-acyltransferase [Gonapodya prolifera JEL478]|eukprot:KXS10301.1 acyl-CoA N-acyltransferase [Gonapodya prolifera JEL478]
MTHHDPRYPPSHASSRDLGPLASALRRLSTDRRNDSGRSVQLGSSQSMWNGSRWVADGERAGDSGQKALNGGEMGRTPLENILRTNPAPHTLPTSARKSDVVPPDRPKLSPAEVTLSPITEATLPALRELNAACFPVVYNDRFYWDVVDTHPKELSAMANVDAKPVGAICCRLEWADTDTRWDYVWVPDRSANPSPSPFSPPPKPKPKLSWRSSSHSTHATEPQVNLATNPEDRDVWPPRELAAMTPAAFFAGRSAFAAPPRILVYIMTIGVLDEYRRMGIASQLLSSVINPLCTLFPLASRVRLHVHTPNIAAVRLYERNGFRIVKEEKGYYAHNKGVEPPDAYLLERPLGNWKIVGA